jgi:hypothetical protein
MGLESYAKPWLRLPGLHVSCVVAFRRASPILRVESCGFPPSWPTSSFYRPQLGSPIRGGPTLYCSSVPSIVNAIDHLWQVSLGPDVESLRFACPPFLALPRLTLGLVSRCLSWGRMLLGEIIPLGSPQLLPLNFPPISLFPYFFISRSGSP